MTHFFKLLSCTMVAVLLSFEANASLDGHYYGVNLPQAGFGAGVIPGVHGKNYLWPSPSEVNMYADMGANILRIPFLWERMQPELNHGLDPQELARLDFLVGAATQRHVMVLLDVHNYGSYKKHLIGSKEVPTSAFNDLWVRLAKHYHSDRFVAFGLMNEPHEHKADEWAAIAQSTIYAIRKTGAKQLILIPGTFYSGAHSWLTKDGKLSNAEALADIKDPANNFYFETHQYFDLDTSGTHATCVNADIGVERLKAFTSWLRETKNKGFLGEFGASTDPVCLAALQSTLKYMFDNRDVWFGWSYWAAAAWFGNYMFNIYPPDPLRFPQVGILKQSMQGYKE